MINSEWTYFTPNENEIHNIFNFDDGNHIYEVYPNEWLINGEWKGKVSLINSKYNSIKINSISKWKMIKL